MDAAAAGSSPSPPPPLRIVICPWLAFGHMLPYLELAERLASRGHRVSFVSTPRNLARLPPRRHSAAVDLVPLPLRHVEGLPDGVESTNDVPPDKRALHWKAFDGLAAPFADFLAAACADEDTRPDWILADTAAHWAAAVALDHEVPCAMLLPTAAMIASCWQWQWQHHRPSSAEKPRSIVFQEPPERPEGVLPYEWDKRSHFFGAHNASGMSTAQRCALTLERCTLAAMRSCPEWEPENFPVAAELLGKPLVPLGLLPPSPDGGRRNGGGGEEDVSGAVRWLDVQPASSVLYVALGSEVPLPAALVHELALGLELAGARFLWALRKPSGVDDADVLPPGFLERTRGRGLVAMGWVPQMSILAHGAVGGFLTHCGRNSLTEGLLFGHPLVMLPIFGDQGPNARAMERRKVGLQVARDDKDGSFDRHGVAAAVRAVMVAEESRKVFVENALQMQRVVADKERQERYVDEFVQELRSYTHNNNKNPAAAAANAIPARSPRPHVAVVAFPFTSHAAKLLLVARALATAAAFATFSFISTADSLARLRAGAAAPANLRFVEAPSGGVEDDKQADQGVPAWRQIEMFLEAAEAGGLRLALENARAAAGGAAVSCVVGDAFMSMAAHAGVPWVSVWTGSPCALLAHLSSGALHEVIGDHAASRADELLTSHPGLGIYRVRDLPFGGIGASGDMHRVMETLLRRVEERLPRGATAVALNAFPGLFQPDASAALAAVLPKSIYVGPYHLLPGAAAPAANDDRHGCLAWLARQPAGAVAYVSFGTVAALPPDELRELASGLEASGAPFLWSLREEAWPLLPPGFLDRARAADGSSGLVVPWAPQAAVLRHPAVGAFVAHSGWGAVVEGMSGGVPMACRPFFGDQQMNARAVTRLWCFGTAFDDDKPMTKGAVAEMVASLLTGEEGARSHG